MNEREEQMKQREKRDDWSEAVDRAVYEDNLLVLGHDEQLAEEDGEFGTGRIIEKLAEQSEVTKQFNSVYVLHSKRSDFVACVNMKDKSLYINANQSLVKPNVLIRTLNGMMLHETLHINKFLGIPGTRKLGEKHVNAVKEAGGGHGILNWVYDLEGHHQANQRGFFNPVQQLELREFLTATRTAMQKDDDTNPLLALEHAKTDEQKAIREIVEDRSLSAVQKAIRIDKLMKNSPKSKVGAGEGEGDSSDGQGEEGQGQGEQRSKQVTVIVGIDRGDTDFLDKERREGRTEEITEKILSEAEYNELARRVQKAGGLKPGTAKDVVNYYRDKAWNATADLKKLEKALKEMQGIDEGFLKQKKAFTKFGTRVNGYRSYDDFNELSQNPEGMITDGEYDINGVKVPNRIKRQVKGVVFILRDVSGSICGPPIDRVVRDATMFLISEAKKKRHKVCVIDFNTGASVIPDSEGRAITDEWEGLLCKSAMLKGGGGTRLGAALEKLNHVLAKEKIASHIPINVYVITDTGIEYHPRPDIAHPKTNVVGIVYDDDYGITDRFKDWIKEKKGKLFEVKLSADKKLIKELKKTI